MRLFFFAKGILSMRCLPSSESRLLGIPIFLALLLSLGSYKGVILSFGSLSSTAQEKFDTTNAKVFISQLEVQHRIKGIYITQLELLRRARTRFKSQDLPQVEIFC